MTLTFTFEHVVSPAVVFEPLASSEARLANADRRATLVTSNPANPGACEFKFPWTGSRTTTFFSIARARKCCLWLSVALARREAGASVAGRGA